MKTTSGCIRPTRTRQHNFTARGFKPQGFTLIEVLVSLAIFMLMMAIIFVPLTLGFNAFTAGNSSSQLQAAANQTVAQMETEMHTAVFVFPNGSVPAVSNNAPYSNVAKPAAGMVAARKYTQPYLRQLSNPSTSGACSASTGTDIIPVENLSRIDFVPARRNADGSLATPIKPAPYVVTYYARRLDITKPFDVVDNPIVMFRAQTPYSHLDGQVIAVKDFTAATTTGWASTPNDAANVNVQGSRYPDFSTGANPFCTADAARVNRGSLWLVQNSANEPNLEPLTKESPAKNLVTTDGVMGTHTLITPRGMSLVAPRTAQQDFTPTTTFVCSDTNGDGKVDRVTIRLYLASAVEGQSRNGAPVVQSQGLPQTVDMPNVQDAL